MALRKYINEFKSFSRSEKNGIFVLLVLVIVFTFFRFYLKPENKIEYKDYSDFEYEIYKFENQIKQLKQNYEKKVFTISNDSIIYFCFDPNIATKNDFEKLGFHNRLINTIINFRNKGGKFRKKEDFKRIWGVSDSIYKIYEPYILIEEIANNHLSNNQLKKTSAVESEKKVFDKLYIDLNTADTTTLVQLKGIGRSYSNRIINYRNKLGGFYNTNQLLEVYGFNSEMLSIIENSIFASPENIKKININLADYKELISHPYLSKDLVIRILDARKIITKFNSPDELIKNNILSEKDFDKIKWYLSVD